MAKAGGVRRQSNEPEYVKGAVTHVFKRDSESGRPTSHVEMTPDGAQFHVQDGEDPKYLTADTLQDLIEA